MSGCYGNSAYDKWLESQADKYWSEILVDDEPTEEEQREAAAEDKADRRRDER
jgi:hypothetical protein